MSKASRLLHAIAIPAMLAFAALPTRAAPVSISVTAFSFAPGSGYGVDANENSGTLLDVFFSSTFSAQNFALNAAGDSQTFSVGTVQFRELNDHSGINANETDQLDVAADFTFSSPFASLTHLSASGTALTGSVSDATADLTIDWNPVQVAFGTGGLLGISLNDLSFSGLETLTQTATITLVNAPTVTTPSTVSEPGTLALAGFALAAVGFVCRRRRS